MSAAPKTKREICFWAPLLVLLGLFGCSEPFAPSWLVAQEKIVFIDSDAPWVTPGQLASFSVQVASPEGPLDEPAGRFTWAVCGGNVASSLKADVNCETVLGEGEGASFAWTAPDLFEGVDLQGHALVNAVAGYPIWVKLTWELNEERQLKASRQIWLFPQEALHPLDARLVGDLLQSGTNPEGVSLTVQGAQDVEPGGELKRGETYKLTVELPAGLLKPHRYLVARNSANTWENDSWIQTLTFENLADEVIADERCANYSWMFLTTFGQLQQAVHRVAEERRTTCAETEEAVRAVEDVWSISGDDEQTHATVWLVFNDGVGGATTVSKTFTISSEE